MPSPSLPERAPPPQSVTIRHVTLIDGTGAAPRHDATVLIRGERRGGGRTPRIRPEILRGSDPAAPGAPRGRQPLGALVCTPATAAAGSAAGQLEKQELFTTLQRVIHRALTPRQRTAVLAKLEGVPQVTLAERLGTNLNALYKLQHDARRRVRQGILAAGFSEADVRRILDRASEE